MVIQYECSIFGVVQHWSLPISFANICEFGLAHGSFNFSNEHLWKFWLRDENLSYSFPNQHRPWTKKTHFLERGLPTPNSWPGLRGISAISNLAMAGHDGPKTPGGAALEPCSGWTSSAAWRRPSPVPPNVRAAMKGELWKFRKELRTEKSWSQLRSIMINDDKWIGSRENQWKTIECHCYPLVICYIAIENCHRNSGFTQLENGGSFHSYVNVYQAGYVSSKMFPQ